MFGTYYGIRVAFSHPVQYAYHALQLCTGLVVHTNCNLFTCINMERGRMDMHHRQ